MRKLITGICCLISTSLLSQNLVVNGDFSSGNASWNNGGCTLEVNSQSVYGGSTSDLLGEIDAASCAQQTICIVPGLSYTLSYDACRRTGGGCTPATVGMNIKVTGVTSATNYVNVNNNYSNTTFGLVTQTYSFTAGATDKQVVLSFSVFNNATTCGVMLDNASLVINPALAISGPSTACTGQATNWSVNNTTGGAGVTYSWAFTGGTPATSTSAAPTGVTWSATGAKAISCQIGNGTCTVITLNSSVNINCALPVKLLSFSASSQSGSVLLGWQTASEINSKHFRIQRSANGQDFYDIGIVNAGNSNYSFTDNQPLPGISYYRLMQVDNDGRSTVSNIIRLTYGNSATDNLVIYPNPVDEKLVFTYHSLKNTQGTIKLYDFAGRVMHQATVAFTKGYNSKEISMANFAKGIYMLEIVNSLTQEKSILRFTKK